MTGKRRYVGRAPGRLDLMGGNGNYTGGLVFEATTAEGTWATVKVREDRQLLFFNPQVSDIGWEDEVEYSLGRKVARMKSMAIAIGCVQKATLPIP